MVGKVNGTMERAQIDTLQSIELAEGVEVRLRVAGPLLRAVAWAIDVSLIVAVLGLLSLLLGLLSVFSAEMGHVFERIGSGTLRLMSFLLLWWYPVFFEASRWGATLGKRWLGLRVVQTSGAPITMGQAVLRNFLRLGDGVPMWGLYSFLPTYLLGLVCCLLTKRFQRIGDLAAGTVVIYSKPMVHPSIVAPPPMDPIAPSVALSADEAGALIAFRDRSAFWSDLRRAEMADHVSELSGAKGNVGVSRLMAMAHWLQTKR